jgi:hypothetical protein
MLVAAFSSRDCRRLAGTTTAVSAFIRGAGDSVLPVSGKVGGSVDRVNGQLDKIEGILDSLGERREAGA